MYIYNGVLLGHKKHEILPFVLDTLNSKKITA